MALADLIQSLIHMRVLHVPEEKLRIVPASRTPVALECFARFPLVHVLRRLHHEVLLLLQSKLAGQADYGLAVDALLEI